MSDYETSSDSEDYDAFDQFANGSPLRIIDWIKLGKVSINARDEDHGDTLLIWACRHHVDKLVRFLVRKGCDLNRSSNADGETALDICIHHPSLFTFLRENGAKHSSELWSSDDEDSEEK